MTEEEYSLFMEEIKEDASKNLESFGTVVEEELAKVANFKADDLDELLEMILENCQGLVLLDGYKQQLKERIATSNELSDRLKYQKGLTKKDIIEQTAIEIYLVYVLTVVSNWLISPDMLIFLRNFIICMGILGSSFWINLSYFTSALRRKQADNTIAEIKRANAINRFDISTFVEFEKMYTDELLVEVNKLCELTQKNEEVKKLLQERNIPYLMNNLSAMKRVRKK